MTALERTRFCFTYSAEMISSVEKKNPSYFKVTMARKKIVIFLGYYVSTILKICDHRLSEADHVQPTAHQEHKILLFLILHFLWLY